MVGIFSSDMLTHLNRYIPIVAGAMPASSLSTSPVVGSDTGSFHTSFGHDEGYTHSLVPTDVPNDPNPKPTDSNETSFPPWRVVGGVIGGISIIVVLLIAAFCRWLRRQTKMQQPAPPAITDGRLPQTSIAHGPPSDRHNGLAPMQDSGASYHLPSGRRSEYSLRPPRFNLNQPWTNPNGDRSDPVRPTSRLSSFWPRRRPDDSVLDLEAWTG